MLATSCSSNHTSCFGGLFRVAKIFDTLGSALRKKHVGRITALITALAITGTGSLFTTAIGSEPDAIEPAQSSEGLATANNLEEDELSLQREQIESNLEESEPHSDMASTELPEVTTNSETIDASNSTVLTMTVRTLSEKPLYAPIVWQSPDTGLTQNEPGSNLEDLGNDLFRVAGARFALFTDENNQPGTEVKEPWASCEIADGMGSCNITVPNTGEGGENAGKVFWVKQTQAADGAYFTPIYATGSVDALKANPTPGKTEPLVAGQKQNVPKYVFPPGVQEIPVDAPPENKKEITAANNAEKNETTFGSIVNSVDNNEISEHCEGGLRVALVLDRTGSMRGNPNSGPRPFQQVRDAVFSEGGLLDVLQQRGSSLAFFAFTDWSPIASTTIPNNPEPLDLSVDSMRKEVEKQINAAFPDVKTEEEIKKAYVGNTNWDAALHRVIEGNAIYKYDLVLFLTDGGPNHVWGPEKPNGTEWSAPNGSWSTIRSIQAPIFTANRLKTAANAPRILALGVGQAGSGDVGYNLQAISGETKGEDYFQIADWDDLKSQLVQAGTRTTCVPVRINKLVTDVNGENPQADSGWNVTSTLTPHERIADSVTAYPHTTEQLTDNGGKGTLGLRFHFA